MGADEHASGAFAGLGGKTGRVGALDDVGREIRKEKVDFSAVSREQAPALGFDFISHV